MNDLALPAAARAGPRQSYADGPEASAAANCFHCGEPIVPGTRFQATVEGIPRPVCCAGCAAVAQAIADGGLADYYRKRERLPELRRESPRADADLRVFDRDEIQQGFVAAPGEHEREATLILEGLSCPACVWLNELHLARQPGVVAAHINYSTRRARVRWDARAARLSGILEAVQAIGYRAYPYDPGTMEASQFRERRDALLRLAVASLGMMQVMMYAFPAYVATPGEVPPDLAVLMRWTSLLLTVPVVAYSALPFFRGALRDLRLRRTGMDVPVALGIAAAFLASAVATIRGKGDVYFDSVAMFVCFLLGARYLEMRARQRAAGYMEYLSRALPAVAFRLRDPAHSRETEAVPAASLRGGDQVLVRPGETFPADGRIVAGCTEVDEALLTGEALPRPRGPGEDVIGGALNRGNAVAVRIERVGAATLLSGIVRLMERAGAERPRAQALADRVAAHFVAFVLAAAAVAALYWAWFDPNRVLPVAVAVLVVTCPCALSLAAPMATAVAGAALARRGLIVTRGGAVEALASVTHFVFDKTGTLTQGRMEVEDVRVLRDIGRARALALAAALERHSEHPLGKAIVAAASGEAFQAEDVTNHPGRGLEGCVAGRRMRIGRPEFVAGLYPGERRTFDAAGGATGVWLGDECGPIARIVLRDQLRDGTCALVAELGRAGAQVLLFSGDGEGAVRAAAAQAGIARFRFGMLPEQKLAEVRALQEQGAVVAMIGDGVNDVPVLAQAQVSIAMGAGAALAHQAADMVLLSPRLDDLRRGIRLARLTRRIVRQNLFWAFSYNAVALPLAMAGLLTPWMAGIGMAASSLFVVLNALRIGGAPARPS